jgi:transposase
MVREILRLKAAGLGIKAIARALGISKNTVRGYVREQEQLTGAGNIETGVLAVRAATSPAPAWTSVVDWRECHDEVMAGTALSVWWEENIKPVNSGDVAGIPYVTFWRHFNKRFPKIDLDFHKLHPPGKACEIDFKGTDPELGYWDRDTGEWIQCRLFGCIMSFSQHFYAEATETEKQGDWFSCTQNAFRYFNGVPETIICDNPAALVKKAHRYDPECNPEFYRFCEHFSIIPQPARPACPTDKNLIEMALGMFWRWIRPKLKKERFYSPGELNAFIRTKVIEFAQKTRRKTCMSRKGLFEMGELKTLRPLPEAPFEFGEWKKAKVHPDSHIQYGYNFYSVPWKYVGKDVEVRISRSFLEIYVDLERQAIHRLQAGNQRGKYTTDEAHLPEAHRAMREDPIQRVLSDAKATGPATLNIIERLLHESRHPLLHLRRCQGIVRLRRRYSSERLESACVVVTQIGIMMPRLGDVEGIIKNAAITEQQQNPGAPNRKPNPNLRGRDYWANHEELN